MVDNGRLAEQKCRRVGARRTSPNENTRAVPSFVSVTTAAAAAKETVAAATTPLTAVAQCGARGTAAGKLIPTPRVDPP